VAAMVAAPPQFAPRPPIESPAATTATSRGREKEIERSRRG